MLSNAFKFTPENGKITVALSTALLNERDYARLTISDTGAGISAQHIHHVFDRFYQIDVNHAGSGIGLALVKAFVELHGGNITVDSLDGKGTIFTVDIPVKRLTRQVSGEIKPSYIATPTVFEELSGYR